MSHTLGSGVHEGLGDQTGENILDQAKGEAEAGPIVSVLEDLEAVAIELDVAVEVHLVEGLHGDLVLAIVLGLVRGLLEGQVVLDGLAGIPGLLVLAGRDDRGDDPEGSEQGDGGKDGEEESGLQATANSPGEVEGNTSQDGEEEDVREALGSGSIGGERGILNGRILRSEKGLAAYEQNRHGCIFLEIETTACAHRGELGTQAKAEGGKSGKSLSNKRCNVMTETRRKKKG